MISFHTQEPHQTITPYMNFDPFYCNACWRCAQACPDGVIVKVKGLFRRFVRIQYPEACRGCLKCVDVCPTYAITPVFHRRLENPGCSAEMSTNPPSMKKRRNGNPETGVTSFTYTI